MKPEPWCIVATGLYDEEGQLQETIYPDEDGALSIPESGIWYVLVREPGDGGS